ncbi:HD domain-containing protein [Clostridium estertheticum]|uniref:HD domain-containing protein n=1 Tax=Clostridium estertheticum TaxID=238834 RepID=UPI0021617778|nr:HD domain-containing protein [Clostridium estertheticum]
MLSSKEAERELSIGAQLNPGPWIKHSMSVGLNAKLIADKIDILDSNQAYVMGVLHDIGRREGIKSIMHTIDGYDYMMGIKQKEIGRICLTHSYPIQDVNTFFGNLIAQKDKRFS